MHDFYFSIQDRTDNFAVTGAMEDFTNAGTNILSHTLTLLTLTHTLTLLPLHTLTSSCSWSACLYLSTTRALQ